LDAVYNSNTGLLERPLDLNEVQRYLEELRAVLAENNRLAEQSMNAKRDAERTRMNSRRGVDFSTFQKGDQVLVAQRQGANKLQARWLGPARVIAVRDQGFVYDVEFATQPPQVWTRHITFLKKFEPTTTLEPADIEELVRFNLSSRRLMADILDIQKRSGRWRANVVHLGFDDEDAVWVLLGDAWACIPDKVHEFLKRPNLPDHIKEALPKILKALH
jgi:hypothetical protein